MRCILCHRSTEWDAVLEGFLEEVTFELSSKGLGGGSKKRGGKSISDGGNGMCKYPMARGTKDGSVDQGRAWWRTVCMYGEWDLIVRIRVMG